MKLLDKAAVIFAIAAFAVIMVLLAVRSDHGSSAQLEFRKSKLDELISGAESAAHCGGYVIIDTDDREVLVGGCDR